jgi:hypothetical protein
VGANGSGKTYAALWHLSRRSYDVMPWIIYDFKYDENINKIEGANHFTVDDPVPIQPGIHICHPHPSQLEEVERQLWEIWENENTGVYIDEGYMMGNNNKAFRALLTQGRSKHIPVIILSQRPVWMDRFVFSESMFFQIFRLQNVKDYKVVEGFVPADLSKRLPPYHSYYYDVGADKLSVLKPVPKIEEIISVFNSRLPNLKKVV